MRSELNRSRERQTKTSEFDFSMNPTYLVPGKDFVVAGYSENVGTGKAKVTLKGIGAYGGTKTLTFRITEKKASF